jgi:hypothetical protein
VRVLKEGEKGREEGMRSEGSEEREDRERAEQRGNEEKQEQERRLTHSKPPTPSQLTKEHTQDPPVLPCE